MRTTEADMDMHVIWFSPVLGVHQVVFCGHPRSLVASSWHHPVRRLSGLHPCIICALLSSVLEFLLPSGCAPLSPLSPPLPCLLASFRG